MKDIYFSFYDDKKTIKNVYFLDEKKIIKISYYDNLSIDIINKKDIDHIAYDKNITINDKIFLKIKKYILYNDVDINDIINFNKFLKKFNLEEWLI